MGLAVKINLYLAVCCLPLLVSAQEGTGSGILFYPYHIVGDEGTTPTLQVVDASTKQPVILEAVETTLNPGRAYALPVGSYHVRIGQFPSDSDWRHYIVEKDRTTIIKAGVLTVRLPEDLKNLSICPQWTQNLTIYTRSKNQWIPLASDVSLETSRYGRIQLHDGEYLLEWNGMHHPVTVTAGKLLVVEPVVVAPFEGFTKPRLEESPIEGLAQTGRVTPCTHRSLYLFPGTYKLTYRVKTNTYPFYVLAEESVTIKPLEKLKKYINLPRLKGKARRYRGSTGTGERVAAPEGS
jgi:hypothetical protein